MTAQSLSFFADHVDVKSDRYEASLPYAMLSVWEDGRILLLRLGPGESRYVPSGRSPRRMCRSSMRCSQPAGKRRSEGAPHFKKINKLFLIKRSMGSP